MKALNPTLDSAIGYPIYLFVGLIDLNQIRLKEKEVVAALEVVQYSQCIVNSKIWRKQKFFRKIKDHR
jgi:hypothetical protein